ncbi:MAG: hypothetical protein ABIJ09_09245 [Pseudomonadota bacterium]
MTRGPEGALRDGWRRLGVLAVAVVIMGCCCPALPPATLVWHIEAGPPASTEAVLESVDPPVLWSR